MADDMTPPADAGGAVGHKAAQLQRDVGELVASLQIRQDAGEYVQREWEALRRLERIATGSLSLAARAREAEGLRAELADARLSHRMACLQGEEWVRDIEEARAGMVKNARLHSEALRRAERAEVEAADLRARCERAEAALREIVATTECRCAFTLTQACPKCIAEDIAARAAETAGGN